MSVQYSYICKPSFREQNRDPELWKADIILYLWQRKLSINNSKQRKSAPLRHSLVTCGLYSEILKYEYRKRRRWSSKGNVLWYIKRLRMELYWKRSRLFISYLVALIVHLKEYTGYFIMFSGITKIYYRKSLGHVFTKPVQIEETTQKLLSQ